MSKNKEERIALPKDVQLFGLEGKNDFLLIGVLVVLLVFFLLGGFLFNS